MSPTVLDALARSLAGEHERVELVHDAQLDLHAVIAIHSTVLGPALGGLRLHRYEHGLPQALDDALRLSRAMTLKASAAGLDLGGGKAVMVDDGRDELREARLVALAHEIDRLGGAYITAEDVGTTTRDMDVIARHTAYVLGRSRRDGGVGGDPSPDTVRTVIGAMRAALGVLDGDEQLCGREVGVLGLGKVGGRLAAWLAHEGAHVIGFDPLAAAAEPLREQGVELATSAEDVLARKLDVLAPCAVGGMIDPAVAGRLRCRVVCGSANNALSGGEAELELARRRILAVPDFLANCGGLIHADGERRGAEAAELERALQRAKARTRDVLLEARDTRRLPGQIAERHALERIERARAAQAPREPREHTHTQAVAA
jgi:glutamate dehydrogenase/leucine dehydrogenase